MKTADVTPPRLALKSKAAPYTPAVPATITTLTTAQAAEFLNVKQSTLEQHRWLGCGCRFVKIGRSVRYRIADLEAYLEERTFGSTTEAKGV